MSSDNEKVYRVLIYLYAKKIGKKLGNAHYCTGSAASEEEFLDAIRKEWPNSEIEEGSIEIVS